MKLAGLLVLAGFILAGCPNHPENHNPHFSKGLRCESFKDEKTCPKSCHWDGATCVSGAHESKCADLKDPAICDKSTMDGKKCHWKVTQPSCHVNPKAQCTPSKHQRQFKEDKEPEQHCCAGTDTVCKKDDKNCESRYRNERKICIVRPYADCVLNVPNSQEHWDERISPAKFCCSEQDPHCFEHNPTCEYKASQGSCIEEQQVN